MLAAAEDVVEPFIPRRPWMDRSSIVQGYAGVYSSFLLHAQRAYVGGQEDMIIDVALALREERERAGQEALASQTGDESLKSGHEPVGAQRTRPAGTGRGRALR